MIIVTSCNRKYLPGVKALGNSIRQNMPEDYKLVCLAHGDQNLLYDLIQAGFSVHMNPEFPPGTKFPVGTTWTSEGMDAMYSRLLIPGLFPNEERVLWLDADTLVTGSLRELETMDMQGNVIAAATIPGKTVGDQFAPKQPDNRPAFSSGVMLIDVDLWNDNCITGQCIDLMNRTPIEMRFVVQSVMNHVIHGLFEPLHPKWHVWANRWKRTWDKDARILHYVGMTPWDKEDMKDRHESQKLNAALWKEYA